MANTNHKRQAIRALNRSIKSFMIYQIYVDGNHFTNIKCYFE